MIKYSILTNSNDDLYIDYNFLPIRLSVHNPKIVPKKQAILQVCDRVLWKRPKDLFRSNNYVLFEAINPHIVHQGGLADCYYLSCVTSLSKWPGRIRKLFNEETKSSTGCYIMYGYINGIKRTFIIDDYLLLDPQTKSAAFVQPNNKELWVLLLEKLWAKINGSFTNIEYGEEIESLSFLTGAPIDCYMHNNFSGKYEELWNRILTADKNQYVLAGSTKQTPHEDTYKKIGLASFHVYSILQAVSFTDHNGKEIKLLVMRDPWHMTDWKGEYSKCANLKNELRIRDSYYADPHCFTMTFNDYLKYFKETTICYYDDSYLHSGIELDMCDFASTSFELTKPFNGYLMLNQYNPRIFRLKIPSYNYVPVFIIIGKVMGDNTIKYVTSMMLKEQTTYIKVTLSPGKYVTFSGTDCDIPYPSLYGVTFYGDISFTLNPVVWDWRVLINIVTDYVEKNREKWKKLAEGLYHYAEMSFELGFGISLIKYEQTEGKICYKENMKCIGLKRVYPRIKGELKIYLEKGGTLISIYLFSSTKNYSYNYQYKFTYL